jgi:hypothetical protein
MPSVFSCSPRPASLSLPASFSLLRACASPYPPPSASSPPQPSSVSLALAVSSVHLVSVSGPPTPVSSPLPAVSLSLGGHARCEDVPTQVFFALPHVHPDAYGSLPSASLSPAALGSARPAALCVGAPPRACGSPRHVLER